MSLHAADHSRTQIRRDCEFDRPRARRTPPYPGLRVQFHAPVRYEQIRGPFHLSIQLEAPAVVWGNNGNCFAFLHDFDERAVARILAEYRRVTAERGVFVDRGRGTQG